MARKTSQELLDEIDYWKNRAETAEETIDKINELTVGEDQDEEEEK